MTDRPNTDNWTPDQQRAIVWFSLPKAERVPRTQVAFAAVIGVHKDTLSTWKYLPGFMDAANQLARSYVAHDVAEILATVRKLAIAGNPEYVRMALTMAGMGDAVAPPATAAPSGGLPAIREVVVRLGVARDAESVES